MDLNWLCPTYILSTLRGTLKIHGIIRQEKHIKEICICYEHMGMVKRGAPFRGDQCSALDLLTLNQNGGEVEEESII